MTFPSVTVSTAKSRDAKQLTQGASVPRGGSCVEGPVGREALLGDAPVIVGHGLKEGSLVPSVSQANDLSWRWT